MPHPISLTVWITLLIRSGHIFIKGFIGCFEDPLGAKHSEALQELLWERTQFRNFLLNSSKQPYILKIITYSIVLSLLVCIQLPHEFWPVEWMISYFSIFKVTYM